MRFLGVLTLIFLAITGAKAQTPIDTIVAENGNKIVVFSDRSWKNIDEVPFNGVMNADLQKYLLSKNIDKAQPWQNDICFSGGHNFMQNFRDTIALDLTKYGDFVIPVPGIVTSGYKFRWKRQHKGIDLNLNTGDTVVAAWDGKVRYAQFNNGGYGGLVVIRHKNGLETFYAHNSRVLVQPNQDVRAGEPIALGGNTGHSFGSHLHFEVRFYDATINPEEIIDFTTKTLKKETLLICDRTLRPGATPTDLDGDDYHEHDTYSNTQLVTSVAAPVAKSAPTATTKSYYKVRSGDTLSKIAAKNNTTIAKLCQLNGMKQTSVLQLGRTIRVR
jgi:murein DD-endopeptidase MepM/ murein hydrolase activator NlpD